MKINLKSILVMILLTGGLFRGKAQNGYFKSWILGDSLLLRFTGTGVQAEPWPIQSFEGVAIFNDSNGTVKYYTNGELLFNSNFQSFPVSGDTSTTQSSIFIKHPVDSNIVYLFTLDDRNQRTLYCHTIDNRLNSGKGGITKTEPVMNGLSEKLAATKHANGSDYWLVVHSFDKPEYYSYLVGPQTSFHSPVVSHVNATEPILFSGAGQLKFSPSGRYAAAALMFNQGVDFFSFNKQTGELRTLFTILPFHEPYGIEFSPDETKLYIGDEFDIYQFDLSFEDADKIISSRFKIGTSNSLKGSLQIGPDNKVYVAQYNQLHLGVIQNPDSSKEECNYANVGVTLPGKKSKLGLPNFPSDYFFDSTIVKPLNIKEAFQLVNSFPTAFTPNNDKKNDCYKIDLAKPVTSFKVSVLNRWG